MARRPAPPHSRCKTAGRVLIAEKPESVPRRQPRQDLRRGQSRPLRDADLHESKEELFESVQASNERLSAMSMSGPRHLDHSTPVQGNAKTIAVQEGASTKALRGRLATVPHQQHRGDDTIRSDANIPRTRSRLDLAANLGMLVAQLNGCQTLGGMSDDKCRQFTIAAARPY